MSTLAMPTRRGMLVGLGALVVAPAIVRATSLMPKGTLNKPYVARVEEIWLDHVWIHNDESNIGSMIMMNTCGLCVGDLLSFESKPCPVQFEVS